MRAILDENYLVVQAGIAGSSVLSGTTSNFGYADGTAIVSYVGSTLFTSIADTCVQLYAARNFKLDIETQGYANGLLLTPEGDGTSVAEGNSIFNTERSR